MSDSDYGQQLKDLELRFESVHGLSANVVHDILALAKLQGQLEEENYQIRYTFTDDEYGEMARKWYAEHGPLKRAYKGDAGVDLPIMLTAEEQKHGRVQVWPNEREMLHTGIVMEFPVGYWGRIVHRSSTEKKHRLRVVEGVIDDYRGEILVQVHNPNTCHVEIHHGARLGQLIIAKTCPFQVVEAGELRPSDRGSNGFGSSGK